MVTSGARVAAAKSINWFRRCPAAAQAAGSPPSKVNRSRMAMAPLAMAAISSPQYDTWAAMSAPSNSAGRCTISSTPS